MILSGRVIKYGDDVNTDVIIPGRYLVSTDPARLAEHAMEGLDPLFHKKIGDGGILVVGYNFGSGSSREQAPIALRYAGVRCVIARSFARIFYRNAINIGLPVLEVEDLWPLVEDGDVLEVDLKEGLVKCASKGIQISSQPLPDFIMEIIVKGGLLNKIKEFLNNQFR